VTVTTASLPDQRKAVALLRLLDAGAAELVLSQLPPPQAQQLRQQLAGAAERPASVKQCVGLLGEFERGVQLLTAAVGPRLHEPPPDDDERPERGRVFTPSGDPLEDLAQVNVNQLAGALEAESPRAAAVLLSQLSPERSAEVLSILPEAQRDAVVRGMSQEATLPPAIVEKMAQAAVMRAAALPAEPRDRTDRVERLAQVLRAVQKSQRKAMLEAIRVQDGATADAIQGKLYLFDDLVHLADRSVQQLLTEINTTQLATALAGADEKVAGKIMNNLSKRAKTALQEELQFRGSTPAREVQQAREEIAKVIARLDQEE
jgi:flagellar motor switch protein FliG